MVVVWHSVSSGRYIAIWNLMLCTVVSSKLTNTEESKKGESRVILRVLINIYEIACMTLPLHVNLLLNWTLILLPESCLGPDAGSRAPVSTFENFLWISCNLYWSKAFIIRPVNWIAILRKCVTDAAFFFLACVYLCSKICLCLVAFANIKVLCCVSWRKKKKGTFAFDFQLHGGLNKLHWCLPNLEIFYSVYFRMSQHFLKTNPAAAIKKKKKANL